jgi:hypothetical protein
VLPSDVPRAIAACAEGSTTELSAATITNGAISVNEKVCVEMDSAPSLQMYIDT